MEKEEDEGRESEGDMSLGENTALYFPLFWPLEKGGGKI